MPGSSLSVCLSVCLFRLSLIVHHKMYPALTPARASSRPDALCSSFSSSSPFSISSHLRPDPHPVYISISRPSSLALPFVHNVRPSVCLCAAPPRARIYPHTYSTYEYIHTATYPNPNPSPVLHAPHPHSLFHLPLRYMLLHTPPACPPASLTPPDHDHDIEFPAAPVAYFLPFLSTSFLFFSVFFLFDLV